MHSPTLLVVLAILLGVMALIQFAAWYFGRRFPAQLFWTGSYLAAFLSAINLLTRSYQPELSVVVGAQLTLFLTAYLMLMGLRSYMGLKAWPISRALGIIAALAINAAYFTSISPNPAWRAALSTLVTSILFCLCFLTITKGSVHQYPARYIFAIPCLAHTIFVFLRFIHFVRQSDPGMTLTQGTDLPPFLILEPIICLVVMAFATLMLISESITSELRTLAEIDPLTNAFNRRSFLTLFDKAISSTTRRETPLAVMLIDLDHFKQTNDSFGHRAGDEVLCHFVKIATACLRNEDVLGRIGGEEFAAFLPDTDIADAYNIAERLRSRIAAQPCASSLGPIPITISIGITQCQPGEALENTLHRADAAMYRAKEMGRNRIEAKLASEIA
ncbi:MAG: GGDEF domain-containing protein [Rhodocyclales bacterium GT-UBC]|nr:MAG: GGDEF domain-containing protein [Rhodocyclales bacterium GT-UBC]